MATMYISKITPLGSSTTYNIKDLEAIQSIATGDSNGQIKITPRSGTAYNVNVKNTVTFTKNTNVTVAGTSKDTYKYDQSAIFAPNGLIMGGTAAAAGLVTRGICGVSVPNDTTGAADKDNLYINFDGTTTYNASRQLVLQAGTVGEHYGNNVYQYAAVRGDAMKAWVEAKGYITSFTDTLVKQTAKTNDASYKILLGANTNPTSGSAYEAAYDSSITINPSTHTITATTFSGNATSATKFASNQSVALTGDVTGSASSQAGWSIATTLANSGVTANTYGNTSQQTPSHGETFNIPYFKVDAKGRITQAGTTTVKLPADSNTDTKVTQNNTTAANDYRILLSTSANDEAETNTINKNTNLRYNPSTNTLSTGNISGTGNLNVVGNANLNGETYAASVTAGSLLINGNTNFVQIPTAPTPAATSNDTSVATTAFVMNAFTANDAMVFKGVVNTNGDLPATHKQGWTYRIATAGTYAGKVCEVGDIIICVTDGTAANNDHWAVIQNNVDGAVYRGTNAFTDANIIVADNTAGKVKSSGTTITTTAPSSTAADTTVPTSKAVWSAISGASGYGKTGTVTSVRVQATSPVVSSSSAASSSTLDTTISLADGYGDTKNPYGTKAANYVLAGPSSGNAAAPSFRKLVAADIPSLTKSKISDFPTDVSAFTNDVGYLTSFTETDPTVPAWAKASSKPSYTASEVGLGNVTNAAQITKSTFTKAYQIMYSTAASTPAVLDANTTATKKFLRMTGTGSVGAVPAWDTVTKSDVGLGNVENTALSTWTGSSNITTIGTLSSGTVPWARLSNIPSSFTPSAHTHYWANVETTSAAAYNTAPEMATLKLNGNISASAASTSNVTLVFDATLQALNFVFA